jgi:hypothetical protein
MNSKGKMASLNWGLYSNNPRITVYTNDPDDTRDNGKITAALDAPVFFAFLELLSNAIKSKTEYRAKIDNKNFIFPGGKRSETPVLVSSLIVGRDEEGVVFISVVANNRPIIKFPFVNPDFHHFFHTSGDPYSKAEVSTLMAMAYLKMMTTMMTVAMDTNYTPPKPREDSPQGNSYGKQSYGGSKGGYTGPKVTNQAEEQPSNFEDTIGW